ncbi:hypothetical protein [Nannocystis punicea]|uniref:Uncharacterized protein n=1 Tax=Nannocystis punicea TaxID=2995304 RepID=A0ABY7GU78_9BACT|nr:hypothetical protein [Nannocystis poenicansa]WAS90522.1 hypothetical protein O0S08_30410 [Nannocystis poenicansa]
MTNREDTNHGWSTFWSWLTLTSDILDSPRAKVACLLFDEIICQAPPLDNNNSVLIEQIRASEPNLAPEAAAFLETQFVSIETRIPQYKMDIFEFFDRNKSGSHLPPLVKLTQDAVKSYYEKTFPDVNVSEWPTNVEVYKLGYYLSHSLVTWFRLQVDGCSFLGHPMEHAALNAWFDTHALGDAKTPLTEIILNGLPNLANATWNDVFEMRSHPHFANFRDKCLEIQRLVAADAAIEAGRLLQDAFQNTLREIVMRTRPKLGLTTVRGMLSNMPLPIPFNPFSIADAGVTLAKEIDFRRKYGWLYFVLDAETRSASAS